jgi:hypothetical protein
MEEKKQREATSMGWMPSASHENGRTAFAHRQRRSEASSRKRAERARKADDGGWQHKAF